MTGLDPFIIRAGVAGLGVALAAAPLGCFVVWRRMAYFGDATAHAAVLGVALSLALSVPIVAGVLVVSLAMAGAVAALDEAGHSLDAILGVLAHSALAAGLVAVALVSDVNIDLMGYLFGDILAVGPSDLLIIWGGGGLVLALVGWRWSALLASTVSRDLAFAANINPAREQQALTIALAVVVAVAIKVVGALLIVALLIIPAAAARPLASTPERMALAAAAIGSLSVLAGLALSFHLDTPSGPTIVCAAAAIFLVLSIYQALAPGKSRAR